ncbi:unnamed protein product [Amaranthus hypochondriacus]
MKPNRDSCHSLASSFFESLLSYFRHLYRLPEASPIAAHPVVDLQTHWPLPPLWICFVVFYPFSNLDHSFYERDIVESC